MLMLGSFLLIAMHLRSEFEGEVESETTQGEGLQRSAELFGKQKEKVKEKLKLKEKERRREKGVDKTGKYRIKESGIGNSWQIGDDSLRYPNAYVNGMSGCELNLIIPRNLTDESGKTKKVEVIGKNAFNGCGAQWDNGRTRSIVLSKYIKVIKNAGLGAMNDVTNFRIEEGSCLESIEEYGLTGMGYESTNENDRRCILVLPSTVTSIAGDGLYWNNLIKTIYYCGSTHLSNYSDLENVVNEPDIKVTRSYKYGTIFESYTPKNDSSSIADAEEICSKYKPEASPPPSPSPFPSPSPLSPSIPTEEGPILSKYPYFLVSTYLLNS